jgi:hypothetical protein
MTTRTSILIGSKEYACFKIPAFQANSILLKLQKLVLPVIGEMTTGKGLDMDVRQIADVVSAKLDDSVMLEIIMPMFKLSQVSSVTDNVKIDSPQNFDKVFSVDDLGDFYELVFEVLKYNFGNFFSSLAARFGSSAGVPAIKG